MSAYLRLLCMKVICLLIGAVVMYAGYLVEKYCSRSVQYVITAIVAMSVMCTLTTVGRRWRQ